MRFEDLKTARVGILGTGREGQAVWRQIRNRFPGKKMSLFAETLGHDDFIRRLNPAMDVFRFGPLDVDRLRQYDILVRSAGISPYRNELQQLRSLGVTFTTACNLWFAENTDARTICFSGTKGKSTTAALMAHLLQCSGLNACLAGNIGKTMLDCDGTGVDYWVIELSSYQISDLQAEPDIAVILNLSDEHVDWHGSGDRYRADKLRLADLVTNGSLIANHTDPVLVSSLAEYNNVIWFNHADNWRAGVDRVSRAGNDFVLAPASLPGEHNMQNLAAVLTVADHLGLKMPDLNQVLASFKGLPHRLQLIGEESGVRYVDDSISTTPVSVMAALQTCGNEGVVLLLGGMDRGLDWKGFAAGLKDSLPHAIIGLPDSGITILDFIKNAGLKPKGGLHAVGKLSQAVALAKTLVPAKGCVLLSPGAPSFPHFRDFQERGEKFAKYAGF